jgi:hypothetical protein
VSVGPVLVKPGSKEVEGGIIIRTWFAQHTVQGINPMNIMTTQVSDVSFPSISETFVVTCTFS